MQKTASPVIQAKLRQALALHEQGEFSDRTHHGVELIAKAIGLNPNVATAYFNLGIGLNDLKRYDEAISSYDKAIALKSDYAEAYNNRGTALKELNRPVEALTSYDKAIALKAGYAEAYNNRASVLYALQRYDEAIASYDKAIFLTPDNAEAHRGRGDALLESKSYAAAAIFNQEALSSAPEQLKAFALNNLIALFKLKQYEKALASYDTAIALRPDYAEAFNNRAMALRKLNRLEEALASYDKAIALKPQLAYAYVNRAKTLNKLKRHEEALASLDKALALKPDSEFLLGDLLHTKMYICDWSNLETIIAQIAHKIKNAERVCSPFPLIATTHSPELRRKASEIYNLAEHPVSNALPRIARRQRRTKIRIGYFSSDFREHPISYLTAELFEKHDRSRFDVLAFSFSPFTSDGTQQRLVSAFDKFIDVRHRSDKEVAMLARELEIDLAVDLNGFTRGCRPNIFSMRAAPVQVNYLDPGGTMGADYMDYLIADTTLIPMSSQKYFSERIAYLPNTYLVSDSKRHISTKAWTRAELGLPKDAFVFCCFNNNNKITPEVFDSWMRILQQVDGSVLWLLEYNAMASSNLIREAKTRGLNSERLIFAERMPLPDHLARLRLADVFLDTLPYNAHTTASDALWAGLPVLTRIGETFAGRVAASLLNAIGLPELITSTSQEYETLAIELATNEAGVANIKTKLAQNRLTKPLFDTQLFTQHIEAAYSAMYQRYQSGLAPDHIYIPR